MRKTRIAGIIMLIAAAAFVAYALRHPEGNFGLHDRHDFAHCVAFWQKEKGRKIRVFAAP